MLAVVIAEAAEATALQAVTVTVIVAVAVAVAAFLYKALVDEVSMVPVEVEAVLLVLERQVWWTLTYLELVARLEEGLQHLVQVSLVIHLGTLAG